MWFQDFFSKKNFGWLGGRWRRYKSREWRRNRGKARSQHPCLSAGHAFPPSKPPNLDHCNFFFQTQEVEGFWRKSPKLASNSTSAQLDSVATNVCLVGFWWASFLPLSIVPLPLHFCPQQVWRLSSSSRHSLRPLISKEVVFILQVLGSFSIYTLNSLPASSSRPYKNNQLLSFLLFQCLLLQCLQSLNIETGQNHFHLKNKGKASPASTSPLPPKGISHDKKLSSGDKYKHVEKWQSLGILTAFASNLSFMFPYQRAPWDRVP